MATSRTKPAPPQLTRETISPTLIFSLLKSLPSPNTRAAYAKGIADLFAYTEGRPITAALLYDWRLALSQDLSASTVNLRLSAARWLVRELENGGRADPALSAELLRVAGLPFRGSRSGNWLTIAQLRRLLAVPNRTSIRGHRNYCILALLSGCAIRLDELVTLEIPTLQQRDGRWVLADLYGKGGRVRTVAVPRWVKTAIDGWLRASKIKDGRLVRQLTLNPSGLSTKGVQTIVHKAGKVIGVPRLRPHDLRRTCARLCRENGGELEQIQAMLGHASIVTTQRYLGTVQNLKHAPNDSMGL